VGVFATLPYPFPVITKKFFEPISKVFSPFGSCRP
jgi:hypothetical protein